MSLVAKHCEKLGFRIEDTSTWSNILNNTKHTNASIILCDPKFDLKEDDLIRRKLLPILKTDLTTAKIALAKLFHWLGIKEKEISSRHLLPKLFSDISNISITNHDKQRAFLKWVEAMGWIDRVREYSPKVKARKYALGEDILKRMTVNNKTNE